MDLLSIKREFDVASKQQQWKLIFIIYNVCVASSGA